MIRKSAATIRNTLEAQIISGAIGHGVRLDETELARLHGVSRTPVREALHMLAASGLAEHLPRRGTFVRWPSLGELVEMFEVMAELECMAVRLATRRASDAQLSLLAAINEDCRHALQKQDLDSYYDLNASLHHQLYALSGNGFLAEQAGQLHNRLRPFRRLQLRVRGRVEESMAEHDQILKALQSGDAESATQLMRSHITILGERFNDLVASYTQSSQSDTSTTK